MWVCRSGKDSVYFDQFIKEKIIGIPWEGYDYDFNEVTTRDDIKELVKKETKSDNRTSISTWAGQIYSFCKEMKMGDYVVIPSFRSRHYIFAQIIGEYEYDGEKSLKHTRKIKIIGKEIKREELSQSLQYSLGAFRTIFQVDDKELLKKMEVEICEDKEHRK